MEGFSPSPSIFTIMVEGAIIVPAKEIFQVASFSPLYYYFSSNTKSLPGKQFIQRTAFPLGVKSFKPTRKKSILSARKESLEGFPFLNKDLATYS